MKASNRPKPRTEIRRRNMWQELGMPECIGPEAYSSHNRGSHSWASLRVTKNGREMRQWIGSEAGIIGTSDGEFRFGPEESLLINGEPLLRPQDFGSGNRPQFTWISPVPGPIAVGHLVTFQDHQIAMANNTDRTHHATLRVTDARSGGPLGEAEVRLIPGDSLPSYRIGLPPGPVRLYPNVNEIANAPSDLEVQQFNADYDALISQGVPQEVRQLFMENRGLVMDTARIMSRKFSGDTSPMTCSKCLKSISFEEYMKLEREHIQGEVYQGHIIHRTCPTCGALFEHMPLKEESQPVIDEQVGRKIVRVPRGNPDDT